MYDGTSMDSLLRYLDQAGGIDPERGSFLEIQVKRGETVRATINLYDFLLNGRHPLIQLGDGDVILVKARHNVFKVNGLADNANRFEFMSDRLSLGDGFKLAKPRASATHVRVTRNTGTVQNVEYYPIADAATIEIANGDSIEFTADKRPGTITVRVEGEHQSPQEYVLPYGSSIKDVLKQVTYSDYSDKNNLQLYRQSVKARQKQTLQTSLKSLESSVLTARSSTNEESRLRKDEADMILQWVERAKSIEPSGQVIIAQAAQRDGLLLENGDILRVPVKDGLVLVSGQVLFPNAIAYEEGRQLEDYIHLAGNYTQSADTSRVIVSHRDGSFEEATNKGSFWSSDEKQTKVSAGDEILVLPKVTSKNIEVTRGISQIIYQIAIAAKVILDL
jgi:molybdopterin converting factor small subunit